MSKSSTQNLKDERDVVMEKEIPRTRRKKPAQKHSAKEMNKIERKLHT